MNRENSKITTIVFGILIWFIFIIKFYNSSNFIIISFIAVIGTIALYLGYRKYHSVQPNEIKLGKLIIIITMLVVIIISLVIFDIYNVIMRQSLTLTFIPVILLGVVWIIVIAFMIKRLLRKEKGTISPASPEAGHWT
jgi:predicted neutral ceramidase superfamily lipid hydrolase